MGQFVRFKVRYRIPVFILTWLLCFSAAGRAQETTIAHGIALYDQPKYAADFDHFDYVNPDAPKGGAIRLMASGTFDTLNPYTLKGISPFETSGYFLYRIAELNEPLMVGAGDFSPSGDEPQTAYGLLAESIEYPQDRSWAIFILRQEARFHDGSPVTADDVVFSFHTLIEKGDPTYAYYFEDVSDVVALDQRRVKFSFAAADNRDMPLRAASLPVMSKTFWQGRDFAATLSDPPLLSGPYRIKDFEFGRYITFERVKDYWGKDLPVNKGRYNFDTVRVDFYRDLIVAFEAFKSGEFDVYLDYTAKNWAEGYDFPAFKEGRVLRERIDHNDAYGYQAFFLNTRRDLFKDRRVREALGLAFDYEWMNRSFFYDSYRRSDTYFPNTELGAHGVPTAEEQALLAPYADQYPAGMMTEPFVVPQTDGSGNNRANIRKAQALLKEAGWEIQGNQLVNSATGVPFAFEILYDDDRMSKSILPYKQWLARLGIELQPRLVDPTQYKTLKDNFDYDVIIEVLSQSLSPGAELRQYFHSDQVNVPGARNYSGVADPAIDAMVERVISAENRDQLITRVHALDRLLLWQHYSIPQWYAGYYRVAWWNKFEKPAVTPPYDFNFRDWWIKPANLTE